MNKTEKFEKHFWQNYYEIKESCNGQEAEDMMSFLQDLHEKIPDMVDIIRVGKAQKEDLKSKTEVYNALIWALENKKQFEDIANLVNQYHLSDPAYRPDDVPF